MKYPCKISTENGPAKEMSVQINMYDFIDMKICFFIWKELPKGLSQINSSNSLWLNGINIRVPPTGCVGLILRSTVVLYCR